MAGGIEVTTLTVTRMVEWEQHLGGKFAAFLQHLIDGVNIELGMCWQLRKSALDLQQLMQHKLHIAQRWLVAGHAGLLKRGMIKEG